MRAWIARMTEDNIDQSAIEKAGEILKNGGLAAFPTETVYGLGGNALDAKASEKIYAAKGRPSDNPLIVHIGRMEDLETVAANVPESARKLASEILKSTCDATIPITSPVMHPATRSTGI